MKHLRKPSVAGMFYPSDRSALKQTIIKYISQSRIESKSKIKFLIVPHAGYTYSGKIAGEAYAEVRDQDYRHIILLGPSHRFFFKGMAASGSTAWQTPLGDIQIERPSIEGITESATYHQDEHCLEVQVPFISYLFPGSILSPILLSGPHSQAGGMAMSLSELDSEDTLWIISSDFNHTGPNFKHYPADFGFDSGEAMDRRSIDFITDGDIKGFSRFLESTQATICGALPILVAMHLIKKTKRSNFTLKNYDCSGRQTGDPSSVGYAALFS